MGKGCQGSGQAVKELLEAPEMGVLQGGGCCGPQESGMKDEGASGQGVLGMRKQAEGATRGSRSQKCGWGAPRWGWVRRVLAEGPFWGVGGNRVSAMEVGTPTWLSHSGPWAWGGQLSHSLKLPLRPGLHPRIKASPWNAAPFS